MTWFTVWLPFTIGAVLFPLGERIGYAPMRIVAIMSIAVACLGVVVDGSYSPFY